MMKFIVTVYALLALGTHWYSDTKDVTLKPGDRLQMTDFDKPAHYNSRRLTVEVADSSFEVYGWDGKECSQTIYFDHRQHFLFPKGDGFEWAFIAADTSREWVFSMKLKNLSTYYQQDGSWVLYNSTHRGWVARHVDDSGRELWVDDWNTGRFAQVFRPYAIDAEGTRFELWLAMTDSSLSIGLPDYAVPVRPLYVDPQWGTTAQGSLPTDDSWLTGSQVGSPHTSCPAATGATIDAVGAWCSPYADPATYPMLAGAYDWGTNPDNLLRSGDSAINSTAISEVQFLMESGSGTLTNGATYVTQVGSGENWRCSYDNGVTGDEYWELLASTSALNNPFTDAETPSDFLYSQYIVYTESGEPPAPSEISARRRKILK